MSVWPELRAALESCLEDLPATGRLVACSGGLDSSVLLHALVRWHAECGELPPRALHVDHGLQAGAAAWAAATQRLSAGLGVACDVVAVAVTRSDAGLEADARRARYAAFRAALAQGGQLLLAHHRDDQAETLLLRLLRGAGPAGLAAMPMRRRLGQGWLLRPFLDLDRSILEAAAREFGVVPSEDPSNAGREQDRNFLRHEILPRLAERWPAYRRTLARAAALCREQEGALATMLGTAPQVLPLSALAVQPSLAALRLRRWLAAQQVAMPSRRVLREILEQKDARRDAAVRIDFGGCSLRRFADGLYLLPAQRPSPPTEPLSWRPPAALQLPHGTLLATARTGAGLRAVAEGYRVRFRSGGERLQPAGRTGHRQLKQLLQEARVPPWERDRLPLIYVGEELVALAGLQVAEGWLAATDEPGWQLCWQPQRPVWPAPD